MRNWLVLIPLAVGQMTFAQEAAQNIDVTKAMLNYDYANRVAKKNLLNDLEAAQRQALQDKRLEIAVAIQESRRLLASAEIPPSKEMRLRNGLDKTRWSYGEGFPRKSDINLLMTKTIVSTHVRGVFRESRGYEYIAPWGITYEGLRFIFNKELTRYYLISTKFEIRTGVKIE